MKIELIPTTLATSLLLAAVLASCRTKPEASRSESNRPSQPAAQSQKSDGAVTAPEGDSATARLVWSGSMWSHPKVVSPDGRYLAFIDWRTGDSGVLEIATGQRRRLTKKGTWDDSPEYAYRFAWSPDSKQLAYTWSIYAPDRTSELRVVGPDGGEPRTLHTTRDEEMVLTHGWTPDGTQVLATTHAPKKSRMIFLSVADGSPREIEISGDALAWPRWNCALSPDGKSVLYTSSRKEEDKWKAHVSVVATKTDSPNAAENLAEGESIDWTPDGKAVLFITKENGSRTIWRQPMLDGKPDGKPQKLKTVPSTFGAMGFTRRGAFYYSVQPQRDRSERIYEVALDPKTSHTLSQPKVLVERLSVASCSYSPDGQQIAYAYQQGPTNLGNYTLCVRSVATGQEHPFRLETANLGGRTGIPRWSRDGRFILMTGGAGTNGTASHVLDAVSGKRVHSWASDPARDMRASEWSRDGKSLFYVCEMSSTKERQILMRNLETGAEKEIYRSASGGRQPEDLALSPDGERLAVRCVRPTSLAILSVSGGEPKEVAGFARAFAADEISSTRATAFAWSADGQHILFFGKSKQHEDKAELYRIAVQGGDAEALGFVMAAHSSISAHPDGRRLLIAAAETDQKIEVWALENFAGNTTASASRDR